MYYDKLGHLKSNGEIAPKTGGKVELIKVQPYIVSSKNPYNYFILSKSRFKGCKVGEWG